MASNNNISAEQKLDSLKTMLADALSDHQAAYKNNFNKGNNSDFQKICQSHIDSIAKYQESPQVSTKAKNI